MCFAKLFDFSVIKLFFILLPEQDFKNRNKLYRNTTLTPKCSKLNHKKAQIS